METCELPLCLNSALCDWLFTCNNAALVCGQSLFLVFYLVNRWMPPPPFPLPWKKEKPDIFCGPSFIVWWKRCGTVEKLHVLITFEHSFYSWHLGTEADRYSLHNQSLPCLITVIVACVLVVIFAADCLPAHVFLESCSLRTVSVLYRLSPKSCSSSVFLASCRPSTYSCPSACLVPCRLSQILADHLLTHVLQTLFLADCSLQTVSLLMFFRLSLFLADCLCSLQTISVPYRPSPYSWPPSVFLAPYRPSPSSCPSSVFLVPCRPSCYSCPPSFFLASCRPSVYSCPSVHLVPYRPSLNSCPPSVFHASCRPSVYSCPSVHLVPYKPSCSLQIVSLLMSSFGLPCFMQTVYLLMSFSPACSLQTISHCPPLFLAPCTLYLVDCLSARILLQSFLLTASCRVAEIPLVQMTLINFQTYASSFEEAVGSILNIWCLFCLSPRSIMYVYVGLNSTASGACAPFHARSEVWFCTPIFVSMALVTKTCGAIHLLFQWACNAVIVIFYSWLLLQESRHLSQVVKISIIIDLASQFHPWWWCMASISSVVFRGPHLSCRVLTAFYQRCLFLFWCTIGYDLVSF